MKGTNTVTRATPGAYLWGVRTTFLLLLLIAPGSLRATAQPVSGVVVEEGTGVPVTGAMVLLLDADGSRADQALTDAAGRFLLEARRPRPHTITVERIGYASFTSDPFTPAADAEELRLEVPVEAIRLRGIVVSAERDCRVRPDKGAAAGQVWEEARKALAAEAWTREAGLYRYTLLRYERRLDRDAREVLADSSMLMTNQTSAFISAPIEDLVEEGFVQNEGDSMSVYYAPDAEALLSDAFLDSHCLGVVDGGDGTVGLAFQPTARRQVPEIAGVIWLDIETAELQRIQFGYVGLLDSPEVGYPPGEVSFTRLPDGAWVVKEWWIRMPSFAEARRGGVLRTGHRAEGGATAAVTDAVGRTVLEAWSASIFGVVTDSAGTGPPPGAVVVARRGGGGGAPGDPAAGDPGAGNVPAPPGVTANVDGSFLLNRLEAGTYFLRIPNPALREMGLAEPELEVAGALGEVAYVRMKVPTVVDALVFSCGGAPRPGGTAPVMGRIRHADGTPAGDAEVRVRWPAATGYAAGGIAAPRGPDGETGNGWVPSRDGSFVTATTTTDHRGLFLLCDVPYGSRLRVAVSDPTGEEPVTHQTFFVPPDVRTVIETITLSSLHYIMTSTDYILTPDP